MEQKKNLLHHLHQQQWRVESGSQVSVVSFRAEHRLHTAADMFLEVVLKRDFPEFITTYLNLDHTFLSSQNEGQVEATAKDVHRSKLWQFSQKTASPPIDDAQHRISVMSCSNRKLYVAMWQDVLTFNSCQTAEYPEFLDKTRLFWFI